MKPKDDVLETMLKHKRLNLDHLHDTHRTAVAVYEAKRELLLSDIDYIESLIKARDFK